MNRKYDMYAILRRAALLAALCGALAGCRQDEEFDDTVPADRDALLASGRYLTAREATPRLEEGDEARWFEVGTRYRLLAYVKAYDENNFQDQTPATQLRFDREAWEDEVAEGGLRFIHVDSDPYLPDQLFGFHALSHGSEPAGSKGLVSLDFYGFTYGVPAAASDADYIPVSGTSMALGKLKREERVDETTGELKDLMWGRLLNQNIKTAGNRNYVEHTGILPPAEAAQSILPFFHCFTRLDVLVVQEGTEQTGEDGNPVLTPTYPNLWVEGIRITNTYSRGNVYLQTGLVEVAGEQGKRPLTLRNAKGEPVDAVEVKPTNTEVGRMFVFPTDEGSLVPQDNTSADGYSLGMEIDVRCDNRTTLAQFLVNTGTAKDAAEAYTLIDGSRKDDAGNEWFEATVVKPHIIDNRTSDTPLKFKQNTIYQLVVTFQENTVRIVTVIPLVMDWLPGEGTNDDDPWQDQAISQPQMFDNVVWSDRNLGADHFDATGADFEKTVGYFYQIGRNIPYFPFDKDNFTTAAPTLADKRKHSLGDVGDGTPDYKLYPMVAEKFLKDDEGKIINSWPISWNAATPSDRKLAQMDIPETRPSDRYFFFKEDLGLIQEGANPDIVVDEEYSLDWSKQPDQPVQGSWVVPTSQQFLTIFPSTPHAGNLSFARGGDNSIPTQGWGDGDRMDATYTTLRVTVPYYVPGMAEPTSRSAKYREAWRTLQKNNDAGTTQINAYWSNKGPGPSNAAYEPNGDPEDGFASIYVISRRGDGKSEDSDKVLLSSGPKPPASLTGYAITEWGTIYAIKRAYTPNAYRMRWRVKVAGYFGTKQLPGLYVEICRYRCMPDDTLTEDNFDKYDWDHPVATIYFPITGLGRHNGEYMNFGTECQYATSDPITRASDLKGLTSALQIKITGDRNNVYMAVIRNIRRDYGMQIRPVGGGKQQ